MVEEGEIMNVEMDPLVEFQIREIQVFLLILIHKY